LDEAQAATRKLARSHYENFVVVSLLLPAHLRQDFCNVYGFCRTADDLGDELQESSRGLAQLATLREQLLACYHGERRSTLFVALAETIARHQIPPEPFLDLISAFEQDQTFRRYQTFDQLRDYCRRSADPVGRLVLYVCGYRDEERQNLSDYTCTALQLANFWQDVKRDLLVLDRIYIPADSMQRFGVEEDQLRAARVDDNYRALMKFEVERTEGLFDRGDKLWPMLDASVRTHIRLFAKGGRAILDAIRRQNFDTLTKRPTISARQKASLLASAAAAKLRSGGARSRSLSEARS